MFSKIFTAKQSKIIKKLKKVVQIVNFILLRKGASVGFDIVPGVDDLLT